MFSFRSQDHHQSRPNIKQPLHAHLTLDTLSRLHPSIKHHFKPKYLPTDTHLSSFSTTSAMPIFTITVSLLFSLSLSLRCHKAIQCDDRLACTIDFCETSRFRCINLALSADCNATRRRVSLSMLVDAVDERQLKRHELALILNVTRRALAEFHPHRLLHLNLHGVDPVVQLHSLAMEVEEGAMLSNMHFHNRMFDIFAAMKDRHSVYIAPPPLNEALAFLPFVFLPYFEAGDTTPRYVVTDVARGVSFDNDKFAVGVHIVSWDGVDIHDAVLEAAKKGLGANDAAKLANAVNDMRVRVLAIQRAPESKQVQVGFVSRDGMELSVSVDWLYSLRITNATLPLLQKMGPMPEPVLLAPDDEAAEWTMESHTPHTEMTSIRQVVVEPETSPEDDFIAATPEEDLEELAQELVEEALRTGKQVPVPVGRGVCDIFSATVVPTSFAVIGRLIISSFGRDIRGLETVFVELSRALKLLPRTGLVVDLRGNLGGLLFLVSVFTSALTPKAFEFVSYDTRVTPLISELVATKSTLLFSGLVRLFTPLEPSLNTSVQSGDPYTGAIPFPLGSRGRAGDGRPLILLADGLTYSAGDIMVSLFKDNVLAPVVIVGGNVGAGGSVVNLYDELVETYPNQFPPLPGNVSFAIPSVRLLRTGNARGAVLESFGVETDLTYLPTLSDRLRDDEDLFNLLGQILTGSSKPVPM